VTLAGAIYSPVRAGFLFFSAAWEYQGQALLTSRQRRNLARQIYPFLKNLDCSAVRQHLLQPSAFAQA
jgi:hypothetical protein